MLPAIERHRRVGVALLRGDLDRVAGARSATVASGDIDASRHSQHTDQEQQRHELQHREVQEIEPPVPAPAGVHLRQDDQWHASHEEQRRRDHDDLESIGDREWSLEQRRHELRELAARCDPIHAADEPMLTRYHARQRRTCRPRIRPTRRRSSQSSNTAIAREIARSQRR